MMGSGLVCEGIVSKVVGGEDNVCGTSNDI
jgi:hypothetical protein